MTEQFHEAWEYNRIAGYKSVILAFHNPIDGCKVGDHRRLSVLVTGIFNIKSPKPRYRFIWDVDQVLNYPNNLTVGSNLRSSTYKLVMPLALTTASRASELTHVDIRYMILPCFIDSHPKRIFKGFGGHKNLCLCKALQDYLKKLLVSTMGKLIFFDSTD